MNCLGTSNDFDMRCVHGQILRLCRESGCVETRSIVTFSDRVDQSDPRKVFATPEDLEERRARIALQSPNANDELDDPVQTRSWTEELLAIFSDPNALPIARKEGVLREREARTMEIWIEVQRILRKAEFENLEEEEQQTYSRYCYANRMSLVRVAEGVGVSPRTLGRDIHAMGQRLLCAKSDTETKMMGVTVAKVHTEGQRNPEYWLLSTIRFGRWKRTYRELISRRQARRWLKSGARHMSESLKEFEDTPMRSLLGALIESYLLHRPPRIPDRFSRSDWEYNLLWAQRRIYRRKSAADVVTTLTSGCRPCSYCFTPILLGCRIDGHKIRSNRRFCNDSCKMKRQRRNATRKPTARL